MRKVLALGATILFVGSVGVAGAQERLQQSGGSAMGVGTGVAVGSSVGRGGTSAQPPRLTTSTILSSSKNHRFKADRRMTVDSLTSL
jgi:hypothetical protein